MSRQQEQTSDPSSGLSFAQGGHPPASDCADKLFYRFHQHTTSDSTATSASNESSPTTTASTVDDSSATDPSPGSSPESPPPSSRFADGKQRPRTSDDAKSSFFELQKQPPPRKGRNLKNLAVNTSRNPRTASTPSLPLQPAAAPGPMGIAAPCSDASPLASPVFVKPRSPPRRKPSNLGLTLLTPASSKAPPQEIRLSIPSTPAFGKPGTLRHFQSSPSLPLFPSLGSEAGLGAHATRRAAPLETILSPVDPVKSVQSAEEEEEQNFDVPLSREEKPEAYPDGPICVHEPFVDLYLEPTAEQCRKYDVVMNVANEVRNPLLQHTQSVNDEPDIRIDGGGGIQYAPKRPDLLASKEENDLSRDSPTTPKATSSESGFAQRCDEPAPESEPEYIHIKWEHNSDIVPDLLRLCKLLDEKVKQSKRVLVHCQCGVSRSASLVVAYGLYKDPSMSVQEAYDAIKKRSKWIGPNMNLIMQLQEFRTSLSRGGVLGSRGGFTPITASSAFSEWRGPFSATPLNAVRTGALSAGVATTTQTVEKGPRTITLGPSSAPSGVRWPLSDQPPPPVPTQRGRGISAVKPATAYVDPSGHIVPVLNVVEPEFSPDSSPFPVVPPELHHDDQDSATPTESLLASPRSAEFAMTPLQPSKEVEPADDFGLMSPTSTGLSSSPFDRSALLASLGMGSMQADNPASNVALPSRSRPQVQSAVHSEPAFQPARTLRGKISSPSLREQQELQSLQARIEASLPHRPVSTASYGTMDDALMSPRATEFTKNPFALALSTPDEKDKAQHLAADEAPRDTSTDPRSPAYTGVSPITRNILDFL
ncbi:Dual specificity phosphatase, catalytic domain [Teratosphaeria destructans]|uniref:protein-tyrosine-phosphatase n=1 Tax=Teratosphaeria destructans TaxID=418781 RepID=A0A9W7T078_9PEZI|nr:Dual specificity phosphatase, catalytic domain [Teratosphaeria destructans]